MKNKLNFRLIPSILLALTLIVLIKIKDFLNDFSYLIENGKNIKVKTIFINDVHASQKPEEKKEEETPDGLKKNEKPVDVSRLCENLSNSSKFSNEEVELLKNLSKRREEITKNEKDLSVKTKMLEAAELKVNNKIAELEKLKSEITDLLAQYNDKENMKIQSLVKIYENMKPKDAAKIFEALDMSILLRVINSMKESKVAPILSYINPIRAKEISTEFANQSKLNN